MQAVLLVAGVGRRLGPAHDGRPKVLLPFGGKTLLQRHIEILGACGVEQVLLVVGHRADLINAELDRIVTRTTPRVRVVENPRYTEGSVVSLWTARDALRDAAARPTLLMDGDVLYDARLLGRLLTTSHADCALLDRNIEPGDEPVKLCIDAAGRIVDLHKKPSEQGAWHGESVGFFRISPTTAGALAERVDAYVAGGRAHMEYEEPLRDVMLAGGSFGFEDVTGLPWTEIDFAEDVRRATDEVLPRLRETREAA
jgi:choline kinase